MMFQRSLLTMLAVATLGLVVIGPGCNRRGPAEPEAASTSAGEVSSSSEEAEIEAALAKLSSADRALAEAQKMCPVSDQPLGSMGTPIKVTVEGREVFVCCEGCVAEVQENFEKYAPKLEGEEI
jgi:hypothetical protein